MSALVDTAPDPTAARELLLVVRILLHLARLSEAYRGGVGGYTAHLMAAALAGTLRTS